MKKFNKRFLNEVLELNGEEVKLVMECQRMFPELLENEATKIESAKKLYEQIGLNKSQWARWYKKNIINNEFFKENADWEVVDIGATTQKGGQVGQDFAISIEFAKHLAMQARTENSHKFRSYFILIESAIKGLQEHLSVREPEKANYNLMKKAIVNDYRNKHENATVTDEKFLMIRECNMINTCVTGFVASEIKIKLKYKDKETREHLTIEINKAIDECQKLITGLVFAGVEHNQRYQIIKNLCENKYEHLKIN